MTVEELEGFLDLISPQTTMFQVEAADNICQAFESLQTMFDSCNRARQAAEAEVERSREESTPLDYVERLERANASLQQQADRGVNCAMKLRIATEHLLKWRKRAEVVEAERDDYKCRWEIEKANRRQVQP